MTIAKFEMTTAAVEMTFKGKPMKEYNFYVYILTNWNNEVMYIGMTNNLERRLYEHKNKLVDGFTKKYNVNKLVYYEHTTDVHVAIAREKEIKKWSREKTRALINGDLAALC